MGWVGSNKRTLTQDEFDALLVWLGPDRELAGHRYEQIRYRLIKTFRRWGCSESEDIADETINRVARKVREVSENYTGDPALYFYGVAQNVFKEWLRSRRRAPEIPVVSRSEEIETEYQCLERCLDQLDPERRDLIVQYYEGEKQGKILQRRKLAERFGVGTNTLRIRAYRIREALQSCMKNCIGGIGQSGAVPAIVQ